MACLIVLLDACYCHGSTARAKHMQANTQLPDLSTTARLVRHVVLHSMALRPKRRKNQVFFSLNGVCTEVQCFTHRSTTGHQPFGPNIHRPRLPIDCNKQPPPPITPCQGEGWKQPVPYCNSDLNVPETKEGRGEGEKRDPFMLRHPSLACLRCCTESVVFRCRMHTPYINPVCRAYKLFLGPGPKSLLQEKEERERGALPVPFPRPSKKSNRGEGKENRSTVRALCVCVCACGPSGPREA